jgi:hypothetical protein
MSYGNKSTFLPSLEDDELKKFLIEKKVKEKVVLKLIENGLDGQMLQDFTQKDFVDLGVSPAVAIQICKVRQTIT